MINLQVFKAAAEIKKKKVKEQIKWIVQLGGKIEL